jgi:hypothetical protein
VSVNATVDGLTIRTSTTPTTPTTPPRRVARLVTKFDTSTRGMVAELTINQARVALLLTMMRKKNKRVENLFSMIVDLQKVIGKQIIEIAEHRDLARSEITKALLRYRSVSPLASADIPGVERVTGLYGLAGIVGSNCHRGAVCVCYKDLGCGYWRCENIKFCNDCGCNGLEHFRQFAHVRTGLSLTRNCNHTSVEWGTGVMGARVHKSGHRSPSHLLHQTIRNTTLPDDIDDRIGLTSGLIFAQMPSADRAAAHARGISCDDAYSATAGGFPSTGHTTYTHPPRCEW